MLLSTIPFITRKNGTRDGVVVLHSLGLTRAPGAMVGNKSRKDGCVNGANGSRNTSERYFPSAGDEARHECTGRMRESAESSPMTARNSRHEPTEEDRIYFN